MKIRNLFVFVLFAATLAMGCMVSDEVNNKTQSDAFVATDTSQPPDNAQPDTFVSDHGQPEAGEEPEATSSEEEAQTDIAAPDEGQEIEVCAPNCAGKSCGDDGCGGVCGQCVADACSTAVCTAQGKCEFAVKNCDDSDICTSDSCDPLVGCQHKSVKGECCKVSADCDDKSACTTDTCDAVSGKCQHALVSCNDGEPCTFDSCDKEKGCVVSNTNCDDDNTDTLDICIQGVGCTHFYIAECQLDKDCDDSNPCTDDDCEKGKCLYFPNSDPCSDSNACTTGDKCASGACVGGLTPDCDDGDECTNDSCDSAKGCQHAAVVCDDGDQCSVDSCDPVKGCTTVPKDCSDGNACTADTCNSVCQHTPLTSGGCCATDANCASGQVCVEFACKEKISCKTGADCDDKDPYTEDICDPAKGCLHFNEEFAFSCEVPADMKAPSRYCELWIGYGITYQGIQKDFYLVKEVGVKLGAASVCGSWWSPSVEVNVRVFGPGVETGPWVGGAFAKMADPAGQSVALHLVEHPWADPDNYGTPTNGIPWCP